MRLLFAAAVIAASPAAACNENFVEIESWFGSVTMGPPAGADMTINYALTGDKSVRSIDGSFLFADAFGNMLDQVPISNAARIATGETNTQRDAYQSGHLLMALKDPDDVIVTSCTRAVIYEDGTHETFD